MTMTGKAHLDYVIRRNYGGSEKALAKEVWIQTHPALVDAKKRAARADHEVVLIDGMLEEMWGEVHETVYPMPDEGNVSHKVYARDKGRAERLAAIRRQHDEEEHELRTTLKAAILKYGVKVPDKVQANGDSIEADALDETFGHLSAAKDKLVDELSLKYGATEATPKFGCEAVMEDGKPHLEVILFVSPDEVEVPSTFCEFPVEVVDGRNAEVTLGTAPVTFPGEGRNGS